MFLVFIISLMLLIIFLIHLEIHNGKRKIFVQHQKTPVADLTHSLNSPLHVYIALCDYFEPFSGNVSQEIAEHRVVTWCREYSRIAMLHQDSAGKFPIHTFFYSEEDYNPQLLDILNRLHKRHLADIEIFLPLISEHIDNFRRKVEEFRDVLFHHHGFLRKGDDEKIAYGFSHGLSSLYEHATSKNPTSDLSDRIQILIDTGCFADFSFLTKKTCKKIISSFSSSVQPQNTDSTQSRASLFPKEWTIKNLLTIQDPVILKWNPQIWRIFPFFENGEISASKKFLPFRANLWLQNCIGINTDVPHLFLKLHTSGGQDQNIRYLLGENGLHLLWNFMEKICTRHNFVLHYVSAWEMYRTINAICLGNTHKNRSISTTL